MATSLAVTARNLGGAVGTVIYTSIFSDRLKFYVKTMVAIPLAESGVPLASLPAVVGALTGQAPPSALAGLSQEQLGIAINGIKQSYSHALRIVYLSSIAFGVLGTVAVAFSKNVNDKMTNQVDIKLDEGAGFGGLTDTGEGHIITLEQQEALKHAHEHRGLRSPISGLRSPAGLRSPTGARTPRAEPETELA